MRKRLQLALMASTIAATSLSFTPQLRAGDGDGSSQTIVATDENGHKIYVNDAVAASPARHAGTSALPRSTLMYWSSKENRWKPVPSANAASMKAARSAAAEVSQYIGKESNQSANAKIAAGNYGAANYQKDLPRATAEGGDRAN